MSALKPTICPKLFEELDNSPHQMDFWKACKEVIANQGIEPPSFPRSINRGMLALLVCSGGPHRALLLSQAELAQIEMLIQLAQQNFVKHAFASTESQLFIDALSNSPFLYD